jgi:hypothetical protein
MTRGKHSAAFDPLDAKASDPNWESIARTAYEFGRDDTYVSAFRTGFITGVVVVVILFTTGLLVWA